jgi:hypothetical protein
MENAPLVLTSNHGEGPGGYKTVPLVVWAPPDQCPEGDTFFDPTGNCYPIRFILTDASGRNAYADATIVIRRVVIDEKSYKEKPDDVTVISVCPPLY